MKNQIDNASFTRVCVLLVITCGMFNAGCAWGEYANFDRNNSELSAADDDSPVTRKAHAASQNERSKDVAQPANARTNSAYQTENNTAHNSVPANNVAQNVAPQNGAAAHVGMSDATQGEYLRAMDQAGIVDPIERADVLASLENPATRALSISYLKRLSAEPHGAPPQKRNEKAVSQNHRENNELIARYNRNRAQREQEADREAAKLADETGYGDDANPDYVKGDNPLLDERMRQDRRKNAQRNKSQRDDEIALAGYEDLNVVERASLERSPGDKTKRTHSERQSQPKDFATETEMSQILDRIENEILNSSDTSEKLPRNIRLRMLYALAGQKDKALEPVPGLTLAQQEFMSQHVFGLLAMLNNDRQQPFSRRAAVVADHLRTAAERLGQSAGLQIRNPNLCTDIKGFGDFKTFTSDTFRPGQEVLLYAELDNYHCETTAQGFNTRFAARYQVLDGTGQRIAEQELGQITETCRNRRRDYFVSFRLTLPATLAPGDYSLKLIVEDLSSNQCGENVVQLKINKPQTPLAAGLNMPVAPPLLK